MRKRREQFTRPFRLYDPKSKTYLRWRCYSVERNAHIAGMVEAADSPLRTVIEVLNLNTGEGALAQYIRRVKHVEIVDKAHFWKVQES